MENKIFQIETYTFIKKIYIIITYTEKNNNYSIKSSLREYQKIFLQYNYSNIIYDKSSIYLLLKYYRVYSSMY